MVDASTSIGIRSGRFSSTYRFRAKNTTYDADSNTVSVDLVGKNGGSGDIYTDSKVALLADGTQIDSTTVGTPRSSFFGDLATLSGTIPNPGGTTDLTLTITTTAYDASGEMQWSVDTSSIDPALVTSDCSIIAPDDPSPGDTITLAVTVTNDNAVSATVDVSFNFGDASETQTVTVEAGSQQTVKQDFTPDAPATFDPSHAVSVQ